MRRCAVTVLALLCVAPWLARGAASAARGATVEPALERFLSRADVPLERYRSIRHLEARNDRFHLTGSLDAMTELSADGHFRYEILGESGSAYIRDKVLRPVLSGEEKLFATGDPSRAAFTESNYDMEGGEPAGPGIVKLFAKARREDVALVDGALFVTVPEANLVRVEGRLAKNPSFWTTRVDLVKRYERIAGFNVPVRLDTIAQIRFAGPSTLSVTYDYQMINGVNVSE